MRMPSGGADQGGNLMLGDLNVHIVEGVVGPVPQIQILGFNDGGHILILPIPNYFLSLRPTRLADRLMTRVSTIRMVAMAKATSVSPRSLA